MAYCTLDILQLASGIYQSLGSPSSQSVGFISGVLTSSGQLGDLNNKLSICTYLQGDGPCIIGMGPEEASIYALNYSANYYIQKANTVLANGDTTAWTNMKEGDTSITREGTAARAKVYMEIYNATDKDLRIAIANWKTAHSNPCSVDGSSLYSFPSP